MPEVTLSNSEARTILQEMTLKYKFTLEERAAIKYSIGVTYAIDEWKEEEDDLK